MHTPSIYTTPLQPGLFYHIYNRGNNRENIFLQPRNYDYFLLKLEQYIVPIAHINAYALLPNHFHLFLEMKTEEELGVLVYPNNAKRVVDIPHYFSEQFRKLFLTYSQAINKQENRSGSLFLKNFKRKQLANEFHGTSLYFYLHANAQQHGICSDFEKYPYSSWVHFVAGKHPWLAIEKGFEWFGSREKFFDFHEKAKLRLNDFKSSLEDF